jgi:hypothetical protein
LHQPLDFKLERCILAQYVPIHILQFLKFLQKVDIRLLRWTSSTGRMTPQEFLILSMQDMVLLAVVNDLFPLGVSVLFREVDPVIRQCEVCGKISAFVFECFLLRLESGDLVACILEGAEDTRSETKLRDGVICVGN